MPIQLTGEIALDGLRQIDWIPRLADKAGSFVKKIFQSLIGCDIAEEERYFVRFSQPQSLPRLGASQSRIWHRAIYAKRNNAHFCLRDGKVGSKFSPHLFCVNEEVIAKVILDP